MVIPSATYRLQFRNGTSFDSAIALIPHLASLGISHLYCSPIFTATAGSTHGYDITDATQIDPMLGGRDGFDRMAAALRDQGIGIILDIVPNHMAASVENPWWDDVLQLGKDSRFASYFDIDWSQRLTLPVLGNTLAEVLAAGEFGLVRAAAGGAIRLSYFDASFPLDPASAADVERETGGGADALSAYAGDRAAMARLLERQHWRLMHWKDAAKHLSYRRFFEVSGLVGLRVEDEAVFRHSHALILDLVSSGQVQGLRVDHVDGLVDPAAYLERLRQAVGPDVYLTVEKILARGESLPHHWPVAGTTGYEFISALSELFIDPQGLVRLQQDYEAVAGGEADFAAGLRDAKQLMVTRNFEGEITRLTALIGAVAPDIAADRITEALQELLIAFPVYRTYAGEGDLAAQDLDVLDAAIRQALPHVRCTQVLDLVKSLMRGEITGEAAEEFRIRFQQVSGPVMAKALEDTLFYRFNRLLAANEVGGDPGEAPGGVRAFHDAMLTRLGSQPDALSATSTHDTKRGEDARARLYALSEGAAIWSEAVERWRAMNSPARTLVGNGTAPGANVEWMLYQALAGIWPADIASADLEALRDRFTAYAEKAMREAKRETDWAAQDETYETAVIAYAAALLSADNGAFLEDFSETIRPFAAAGFVTSQAQTVIKLTAPGVPDIYQGTEGFDFSLVDPDNRRPLDLASPAATETPGDADIAMPVQRKQRLIRTVLQLRRRERRLFAGGDYCPLDTRGTRSDHVVAFARIIDEKAIITIAPRLVLGAVDPQSLRIAPDFWGDTHVCLPGNLARPWQDLQSGLSFDGRKLSVAELLATENVAVLFSSTWRTTGGRMPPDRFLSTSMKQTSWR